MTEATVDGSGDRGRRRQQRLETAVVAASGGVSSGSGRQQWWKRETAVVEAEGGVTRIHEADLWVELQLCKPSLAEAK